MASIPDIDLPPSFPLAHSAQRASAGTTPRPTATASANKAAPSFSVSGPNHNATASSSSSSSSSSSKVQALRDVLATGNDDEEGSSDSSSKSSTLGVPSKNSATLSAPTPSSSSLMPPPSTSRLTAPPGVGGAPTSSASSASSLTPAATPTPKRKKVILTPGHSPLDWARLKSTLSPPFPFRKIPLSEVKQHKSPSSAWTVLKGKVYDMTPYAKFHPGGEEELMRVAGRDGTRLFMLTHSWVNVDSVVDGCCIGIAVRDD